MGEQAHDGRGQERDDQRQDQSARVPGGQAAAHHAPQQVAIQPDDGQDRAELDDDLERVGARADEAEGVTRQDQMPCRRDGEKLGRTLDEAEDDRGDDVVQGSSSVAEETCTATRGLSTGTAF